MKIEYTGRQTEVPQEIRVLTERKLRKLANVLHGITHVHVILTADKHRQIAEVTVRSRHLSLAAAEESGDLAGSLSAVIDKLTRQAQKHLGRLRDGRRRVGSKSARGAPVAPPSEPEGVRPRIIRSRRFVAKPMTVDEAVLALGASEDGPLVFRDAATERVTVLYLRKDGNLGLIEPEA